MNRDRMDVVLADWLSEGPERGPAHALDRALAATRRVDQRPGWAFPGRWVPGSVAEDGQSGASALTGVALLLVGLLLVLVAFAIAIGGAQPRINSLLGPSADRLVAFQGGTTVYVSRIDGSALRTLSVGVPYAHSPSFSPDGTRVAFLASSTPDGLGGRLMVVPVAGSQPVVDVGQGHDVVPTSVPSVAWSPDGQRIAFASVDGGVATIFVCSERWERRHTDHGRNRRPRPADVVARRRPDRVPGDRAGWAAAPPADDAPGRDRRPGSRHGDRPGREPVQATLGA